MHRDGLRKKIDYYINSIVDKRISDNLKELSAEQNKTALNIKDMKRSIHDINVQMKESSVWVERLEGVEEKISNNKYELLLMDIERRLQVLEENIRNNNNTLSKLLGDKDSKVWGNKIEVLNNRISNLELLLKSKDNVGISNGESFVNTVNENYDEIDYFCFENYFRGCEDEIRKRQEVYLPYFQKCNNVVDLGCGRGEFLELLKENNINAQGIDFYEEFVTYGRNKGLKIEKGDAIEFLKNLSGSTDGIFAGQLVEHLSIRQINALCKNAFDKLEKGKYLIMETPNPMSLAIYTHAFYIDPSHQKPVHPFTLRYLAEKAGFSDVQILFLESSKLDESIPVLKSENIDNLDEFNAGIEKLSDYLYGCQDYAIIAKK